jgi:hypothetical protein
MGKREGVERLERGAKLMGINSLGIIIYYYSKVV